MRTKSCAVLAFALLLQGCSSKPRNFTPVLAAPPADEAGYQAHLTNCQVMVATGGWKDARGLSAAGGAVIGTGAGVAAGTAVASAATPTMVGAAAAATAAAAVALPVFGVLGAWGISKVRKSKNERAVKAALTECVGDGGYSVQRWRAMSKEELRALRAAEPAIDCNIGPLHKMFGGQPWVVYSCSDGKSFVAASAPGNAAAPFYFFVQPVPGGYDISGKGNGSREAASAAFEELKSLGSGDVRAIIASTRKRK